VPAHLVVAARLLPDVPSGDPRDGRATAQSRPPRRRTGPGDRSGRGPPDPRRAGRPTPHGRTPLELWRPRMSAYALVDAHHHIWRMADLPWLSGAMVP